MYGNVEDLNCDVAAIQAVAEVEARGAGFLGDGRPKILFERHKFRKYASEPRPSTSASLPGGEAASDFQVRMVRDLQKALAYMGMSPGVIDNKRLQGQGLEAPGPVGRASASE
jgi:hypothetical protein